MRRNYVRLAGGLGNQLFQIAFGRYLPGSTEYFHFGDFESETAKKIIESFGGKLINLEDHYAFKKLANLSLRLCSRSSINPILKRILERLIVHKANMVLKTKTQFNLTNNLDYIEDNFSESKESGIFIGYFQSFKFADQFQISTKSFLSASEMKILEKYKALANSENPIALQVRLGDYLFEKSFGIPSVEYFHAGLETIDKSGDRKIWIFSNDNDRAFKYLPKEIRARTTFIDEPSASPLLMLSIMSLANDFVISNSTFGWWGAFLGENLTGMVVVPEPWFAKINISINLIPPNWIKLEAGF